MKIRKNSTLLLSLLPFIQYGCSYRYLHRPFRNFSESTDLIGKNTSYLFQQLQEEEIEVPIAESLGNENLAPADLEPRVMSVENLALREERVGDIVNYTAFLEALVPYDYQEDIRLNAERVYGNIDSISINHQWSQSSEEIGLIASLAAALPEAVIAIRNRSLILKVMKEHQPLIDTVTETLKEELEAGKSLINNYYARQFRILAAVPWNKVPAKRHIYARTGAKILDKKRKLNVIFGDLIGALDVIPQTHKRLLGFVKTILRNRRIPCAVQ